MTMTWNSDDIRRRLDKAIDHASGFVDRPASEAYAKGAALALCVIAECLVESVEMRKAGELLKELPREMGGRPGLNSRQPDASLSETPLQETGIPEPTRRRWQQIAEIPERDRF